MNSKYLLQLYIKKTVFLFCLTALPVVISCQNIPYNFDRNPITFLTDAGWCWYEDPRAIIHNGKLLIGGISGQSGDVRIGVYDLEKGKNLGVVVIDKSFEVDDHNSPVFYARPDGSILASWAKHGKENTHYYSISNPDNYLKWSEKKKYIHDFELSESRSWGGVTYTNLYHIKDHQLLYNFFRDGPTYNPAFFTSSDYGNTWSSQSTHFIVDGLKGRNRPYARYMQVNENRIGVSFTDGHPRRFGNSLYYAEFDGRSLYNVNGSKIKDIKDGPLRTEESEKIYTGSEIYQKPEGYGSVPNAAWTCDSAKDENGYPFIGYTVYHSDNDNRFRLASWDGKKWNDREIAFAGEALYPKEASYTGLLALDPEDPTKVFISTPVNPNTGKTTGEKHEIYMTQLDNNTPMKNITWKQVTFNSKYKNIRPVVVSGEGYKVLLWLGGKPWRKFQDYETDVLGYILIRP